jgi:hypothetical protein
VAQTVASTLLRLTLRAPEAAVDVAAPLDATPAHLLGWAPSTADERTAAFTTLTGRALSNDVPLRRQGVDEGDVVVLVPNRTSFGGNVEPVGKAGRGRETRTVPGAVSVLPRVHAIGGTAILATSAFGAALTQPGPARTAVGVLLLLVAVTSALGRVDFAALIAPGVAGAGGFVLAGGPDPGADRVALVAAALAAAHTAALTRFSRPADENQRVWLVASAVVAVVAGAAFLGGAPMSTTWAVLAGVAVLAVRLLPSLVVDVPEEALLDIDRLRVTAWSARTPRHTASRRALENAEVREVVARGQRMLTAGTVAAGITAAVSVAALLAVPGAGAAIWGAWASAATVGGALLLAARTYRGAVPRAALCAGGTVALVAFALAALAHSQPGGLWGVVVACTLLAVGAVAAAVAFGRGWRSVWWGRVADVLDGIAVTLSVPATLVAAGGFDYVHQLVS